MGRPLPEIDQAALDPDVMQDVLHQLVRNRYGSAAGIRAIETAHLKRGVYRYVIQPDAAIEPSLHIVGKVFDDEQSGRRSFEKMQQLRQMGFADTPPVHVKIPEDFCYLPELRLLLMQEAPGTPLKRLVKKQTAAPAHLQNFAATLAKLHRFSRWPGEPFTLTHHLQVRCNGLAAALAEAFPEVRDELLWLLDQVERYQRQWGTREFTLAHGDFHLGQVHVHGEEYWLLDLDPLHCGDPAYDVAMVLFILKQEAAKRKKSAYIATLQDAFSGAYFAEADWKIAERIPLQEAMIHLKRACKRFYWQDEEGWEALIPRQIRQAVHCARMMTAHEPPRSVAALRRLSEQCPVRA